jgi:hypothetical protein
MTRTLFLSASVPDPKRHKRYHSTADKIAIRDATRALVTVALPHLKLVWGGHPAITPLVRVVAERLGFTDADKIRLFQSDFFRDVIPKDNAAFEKVTWVKANKGDREESLRRMRLKMLSSEQFFAGIFIGGMEGVEEEYCMFREMHPKAFAFPIASTGAAALILYKNSKTDLPSELETDLAYPSLFRRLLQIPSR